MNLDKNDFKDYKGVSKNPFLLLRLHITIYHFLKILHNPKNRGSTHFSTKILAQQLYVMVTRKRTMQL